MIANYQTTDNVNLYYFTGLKRSVWGSMYPMMEYDFVATFDDNGHVEFYNDTWGKSWVLDLVSVGAKQNIEALWKLHRERIVSDITDAQVNNMEFF